jgi:chromatin remodeling complex protein RSC6
MSASATASAAKKSTKATKAAAPAAPAAAPAAPAPVVAAPAAPVAAPAVAATEEKVNVQAEFNGLVEKVNSLRTTMAAVFSDMKKLEKQLGRELKKAQKGRRRKASAEGAEGGVKKETVFTKPTQVSDALCTFLGKPKGTQMSRSDVTKALCAYARDRKLMDKQVIKADAPLRKLLALSEKDELKILNLQRYLKPHYIKPSTA